MSPKHKMWADYVVSGNQTPKHISSYIQMQLKKRVKIKGEFYLKKGN